MTISGPSPEEPTYKTDFKESVDLFEKSFLGLQSTSLDAQRDQYLKVMHETLKTMQESATGMLNERLMAEKNNLSKDLNEFLASPTNDHLEKVQSDINRLKDES